MAEIKKNIEELKTDLLGHININRNFMLWMTFLMISLGICLFAYALQLKKGLGVTGMRDYVSWGMYIANFVFFVATSLIGMLISSVLGLMGYKWITPISRIAEIIAVAFAALAGLVIVMDMGRPERLLYVFIYGRFQSPIFWDVSVVVTYTMLSVLLLFLPLIPDIAICRKLLPNIPAWLKKAYQVLSFDWTSNPEQNAILRILVRILLLLLIPMALAIHTVTAWLFAVNSRPGWDSTIFGPYFVTGAFVDGTAAVIILMYFFRNNYRLQDYLTDLHFNNMGKLLLLVSLVYLYFNINEYLVPGYKLKKGDYIHLNDILAGRYALLFWLTQIGGLLLPCILLLFKKMRKSMPLLFISIATFAGAWFKRYIIVVPTMEHPFLPIQHVPENFRYYTPTWTEIGVTMTSFVLLLLIITVISKLFPVIPFCQTAREKGIELKDCIEN